MLAAPWVFLGVALVGLGFTVNGFLPIRRSRVLLIPSFLLGVVAAELAMFHVAWQGAAFAALILVGGLGSAVGYAALGVAAISVAGLVVLILQSRPTARVIAASLTPFLGRAPHRTRRLWRLLYPFPFRMRRVTRNVVFAKAGGQKLRLDVYHPPADTKRPAPAVIHIHGGGWVVGDKREQGVPLMTVLSDRGFVGFNINYRLSPGATWPDHLIDIKRAIAWVREHADEYGVDPSFVAVAGGSAGGHLTAMVSLTQGDSELQPGFEDADTSVQAAVCLYAVYDITNEDGRHAPGFHEVLMQPLVIKAFAADEPERFEAASPSHRVCADAPPFFVIHGDRDSLAPLDDAREFAEALRRTSSQPVLYAELTGAHHSFDLFISPRSLSVLEGVGEFLEEVRRRRRKSADRAAAPKNPVQPAPSRDADAAEPPDSPALAAPGG